MKNFAIALVSNHEDKEQWFFINSITREEEKETALLAFIHKKLKLFPGWLLIFDNLDNFKWMKKYIPHDALLCGNGYVLITTRNANNLFGETFKIPDLSEEEVVSLFTKYFSEQSLKTFKKEYDFIAFLKQIPHYPLDVTVASRYLEDSKMGYREYLLKISTNEFEKDQKNLLASEHDYDKTRRDIIRASVEKVISVDDRYISLLYLISMVNSENITRDMLSFFTDQSTSNQFIRELKKYSLITFESMERKEAVFSLHRNIQESIFFEMKNYFDKKNSKQIIHEVVLTTEKYANYLIKLEDYNKMLLLIPHLEFLLKREGLEKDDQNILKAIHCSIIDFLDLEEMHYKTMKSAEAVIKDLKNSDPFSLRLSNFLMYYGHLCGWHGEYEKSIRALEESLSIALKLKCSSLEVLTRKSRLATMYRAMSDYKKASILIDDCAHEEKVYGEHYYEQSFFYAVKGLVFRDTGKYLEALTSFEKSVNLLKEHRPNYLKSAQQISWLANFYIQVGLSAKGIELIENNGIDCGYRELVIGLAYVNQRQYTKAYKALSKLMKKAQTTNYVINYNYFKTLLPALGRVYIHFGEYAKAQEILEESLERLNKHYGVGHFQTAVTITYLGEIDLCRDNLPAAEIKMLKAYHLLKKCHHADVHIPLEGLSKLYKIQYERSDKKDEAYSTYYEKSKAYLLEASKIIHDNFPKDSIHIVRIKNELKFFLK